MDSPTSISSHNSAMERTLIPAAIVFAGVIIAGSILYSNGVFQVGKSPDVPEIAAGGTAFANPANALKNIEDDDPTIGNPDAPVVLVEFSDFQCPFCRKFWRESFLPLKEKYIATGKVRFVYRDFPLNGIHPAAEPAALVAECADDQGKFWVMHDKIFFEQEKLGQGTISFTADDLTRWAREIELDMAALTACLQDKTRVEEVQKDYADGSVLGVGGTPQVFVNGKLLIRGALPYAEVESLIEQALAGQ